MYFYFSIYLIFFFLSFTLSEAFFGLADKPIFVCFKVCPLYCSPRRSDEDGSPLIYLDESPYDLHDWVDEDPHSVHYPYDYGPWVYCPPPTTTEKPTTTTMKTTTTTEEPTWICMVCKKKCNYPS